MSPNGPVGPVVPVRPTELLIPLHGPPWVDDDEHDPPAPPPLMGRGCNSLLCATIIVLFLLELHCDILFDTSFCI